MIRNKLNFTFIFAKINKLANNCIKYLSEGSDIRL